MEYHWPKISIVTPSFNQGKFIEDAIKSVLAQDYPNFEHIIVDNCSTDETIGILKKYPHLKWISEPDMGQSDALNKGFKMVTGEIVGWLNGDDFYLPEAFHVAIQSFGDLSIDIIYGDYRVVDYNKRIQRFSRQIKFNKKILIYRCYIPSTTSFFRQRIIEKGLQIDKKLNYVMDKDFFLRLANNGYRFKHIPSVFAAFRWQGQNKTMPSNNQKFSEESMSIIRRYRKPLFENSQLDNIFLKFQVYYYRYKYATIKLLTGKFFQEKIDFLKMTSNGGN